MTILEDNNETIKPKKVKKSNSTLTNKKSKQNKLIEEMNLKMLELEKKLKEKEEEITQAKPTEKKILDSQDTIYRKFTKQIVKENDKYDNKLGFQKYGESKWQPYEQGSDKGYIRQVYINLEPLSNPNLRKL